MNYFELMIKRSRQAPAPAIPTDYVFYAPLHEDLNDVSQYARTLTTIDGTPVFTTENGIPCCQLDDWCFLETTDMSGISSGNHDFTLSVWYKPKDFLSERGILFAVGRDRSYQDVKLMTYEGYYAAGTWDFDNPSEARVFQNWVNLVAKYVASTRTYSLYINGYERFSSVCENNLDMPTEEGRISIGSLQGSYTTWWRDFFADAYVYNRALSDNEISALALQHEQTYTLIADSAEFSYYPVWYEEQINYVSPNEPTFEIISGSLPSTLTLGVHTGKISGTAPLDADHTYNLVVRLTAPNSTPTTCSVTVHTYATARINIDNMEYDFTRDGNEASSISFFSDEEVTFAVEQGYSLPSGITMSGNVFYFDGTTTAGTYTVVIRGTSEHNQTGSTGTMTFNVSANVISIDQRPIVFYTGMGSYSKPLKYTTTKHEITPVYTLSGTLPAGVTFNSQTGVFTSDGTQSQASSATISMTVASSTGLSTPDTESMSIQVEMGMPVVPSDYIWYTPFTTDYEEETSGIVGVAEQPSAFSIATDQSKFGSGFLAARKTQWDTTGIEYQNTATYMDLSAGTITISLWLRAPDWSSYSQLLGGTRPEDGADGFVLFADYEGEGVLDFRSATNESRHSPLVNADSYWHHYLFTRTAQGAWTWYKDGVASTSGTGDMGGINGTQQNMKIGGGWNWGKCAYFDLAHFRVYDYVLDDTEIYSLYHEFD